MPSVRIRAEGSSDHGALRDLHAAAFGPGPVPDLVDALRASSAWLPGLSLLATGPDDRAVGHVLLTRGWLDTPGDVLEILVLSPLAVLPTRQRAGIGRGLLAAALDAARRGPYPLVVLEGSPAYYSQHGFVAAETHGYLRPSARIPVPAFQAAVVGDPPPPGRVVYPDPFWALGCVGP